MTAAARVVPLLALLLALAPSLAAAVAGHPLAFLAPLAIAPGVRLALVLLAPAVLAASLAQLEVTRWFAALGAVFATLMLIACGVQALRAPATALPDTSLLSMLQPSLLTALGIGALAGALLWRREPELSFDASALLGVGASALFALVVAGHLFGAQALIATGGARGTPTGSLLLLALALASLSTHAGGPVTAYLGDDPGAVARRRMLPAAVLTPVAAGFLLLYAINGGGLTPALAVALTVFANVAVMLLLIHGAGNKVAAVAQAKEEKLEARAAAARRQVTRDPLTGLLNRRGWDLAVQQAQRRCVGEGIEAGVLMIDLDGLKHVNDTQGHKAGDALIQAAAAALKTAARRGDALARLGGDEFGYLVPDCDAETAGVVATRFEQALAAGQVAASVGYAVGGGDSLGAAIEAADQAMYQRKRARKLRRA